MTEVREATADDLDALVAIETALFTEDAGQHDPHADVTWPAREGRADFERLIASERSVVLAAVQDGDLIGALVGYAADSAPTRQPVRYGVIRSLYVVPGARRSGAASDLVERFVGWARERECVEAHVDHYAANLGAAKLYDDCGFETRSVSRVRGL